MDFMQNLPLPHIPVQEVFYYRQLWVNVFNIHNISAGNSMYYVYHEGQAKKGPDKVCTMLVQNELPPQVRHLHLFSDACGGQNRNHTLLRFLCALVQTKRFETINYYTPIRGHSFMPNDRNFGALKRLIKRLDRVYVPKQYVKQIANATKTPKKAMVTMVSTEDIKDYKQWWPLHYRKKTLSDETKGRHVPKENKVSFLISKYHHFRMSAGAPGVIKCWGFIDGLDNHTFSLGKHGAVELPNEPAYNGKVPLNVEKKRDIEKLIKYIPSQYLDFYEDLRSWPTTTEEDEG